MALDDLSNKYFVAHSLDEENCKVYDYVGKIGAQLENGFFWVNEVGKARLQLLSINDMRMWDFFDSQKDAEDFLTDSRKKTEVSES